jgi:hypothetical protein
VAAQFKRGKSTFINALLVDYQEVDQCSLERRETARGQLAPCLQQPLPEDPV